MVSKHIKSICRGVTVNTKRTLGALVALFVLAVGSTCFSTDLVLNDSLVKVLFNPGGRCADAVVSEINNAKTDILVQAYSFTSKPIAEALVEAHKRGVKVEAVIDGRRNTGQDSKARLLVDSKVPVFTDTGHPSAHNKVMVIDGKTVITGSFNFTKQAGKNAENLLIIKSPELAKL